MAYIPRFIILCICALLLSSPAWAKKGHGGKRPQGAGFGPQGGDRPQGDGIGPQGGDRPERPQGGDRPERPQGGRGPPGIGVFALNGAEDPTLLSTIELGSEPTMAAVGDNIMMVYHNHTRDENTGVPKLVMSTSTDGGNTWSAATLVTINGLPADITVTINPTLSSDGQYLYFTGASGKNLKQNGTAIYVASYDGGSSFSNAAKAFSMDGSIVINSAVANGIMIVPQTNKRPEKADDTMPTGARKLLKRKPGRKPNRESDTAYLASCTSPSFCTFVQNVTMPEQDTKNSFVGSMLYENGVYEFYGSGPGPWPVTSTDGKAWSAPATEEKLLSRDPSVIVYKGAKIAAAPVKHSKPVNSTEPLV